MSHIAVDARIISTTTGRYVERLLTYLQDIDMTNTYTILVREKDREYWKPHNPNFSVRVADYADYSLAEQIKLKALLNEIKPDLVHFCMPQQPITYTGKHVTTIHDLTLLKTYNSDKNWLVFHFKQLVGRFVFWRVAHSSAQIIVPTKFTAQELIQFANIPTSKVTLTYEAADPAQTASTPYETPFKQYIMYVGQQSDYKNIKRLAAAHQQLLAKYPDLGLILVGKLNPSAAANQKYFTKKKYKNIHFTGFVTDDQLAWLYQNTATYVFASLMEGFGLPGLEAMSYGAPVASSNATCLPEVYGDAAHYFNPKSVDDIARAIDDILRESSLRNALITKGTLQITKYSWKRMAEQTYDVYKQALTNSAER